MMKRMVIVGAVMAIVASSAMASSLVRVDPVGTATTAAVFAITNDGAYASGHSTGGTTDRAFIYKVSDGSVITNIVAGSYLVSGTGIGYRANASTGGTDLVVAGKQSSAQIGMFTSSDGGATWSRPFSTSGSAPGTASWNSVGSSGDTAWLSWAEGTTSYSVTRIYGDPVVAGTATKSSPTAVYSNGMSNTGRAACIRRATNGTRMNVYLDFTSDGGTAAQNIFAGLDGTTYGQASAMSGDGTAVFGQSPATVGSTTNYPYKYTVGGSASALALLPGTAGSVSLGYVYGASVDGQYAVGMDYVGMERAALWDSVNGTVLDLTQWITDNGLLNDAEGAWTGNLRRAYTIGTNAQGQLVIGGMGVYYYTGNTTAYTRGFILTIPEPATLSFLALGGLALLRRRR